MPHAYAKGDRSLIATDRRAWSKLRAAILIRDSFRCGYCGEPADTVDHRVPRMEGGSDDPSNLVACCRVCQVPGKRPARFFRENVSLGCRLVSNLHTQSERSGRPLLAGEYRRNAATPRDKRR